MTSAPLAHDEATLASGAPTRPHSGLARGQTLGRYVVLDRIGAGGMGIVYSAYDPKLDRKVAVKLLHPDDRAARHRARLATEARALARLSHKNVVAVFDVGDEGDAVFIAMEYIDGVRLDTWLTDEPPWAEVVDRFVEAGRGLAAAHAAGLVHGDFKPANVKIASDGRVVVMDFGLAQLPESSSDAGGGTPRYMSPEQHGRQSLTSASDQFSFCVALYEALFGAHPFGGGTPTELATVLSERDADVPGAGRVPRAVTDAVLRGLSRRPSERWPDIVELLEALEAVRGRPSRRRRVLGAAFVVGLAVPAFLTAIRSDTVECDDPSASWDGLWDTEIRAQVDAMLRRDAGPEPAAHAIEALDDYVASWSAARRDACEATHVDEVQSQVVLDQRVACLERRRDEVAHVVSLFQRSDPAIALRAVELVSTMAPLLRCSADAVRSEIAAPSENGDDVASIREELALTRALRRAAQYDEADLRLAAAMERAHATEHTPLLAEAYLELGYLRMEQDDPLPAHEALEEAVFLAMDSRHERVTLEAAIVLVDPRVYNRADIERARAWERRARGFLARRHDPVMAARLEGLIGAALRRDGRADEARVHLERAAKLFIDAHEIHSVEFFEAAKELGFAYHSSGAGELAIETVKSAWQAERAVLGERHPNAAGTLMKLGALRSHYGERQAGERDMQRAIAVLEATPLRSRHLGGAYNNLGNHYWRGEQLARAQEYFLRAADAWEDGGPRFADSLVYAYSNLAGTAVDLQDWAAARDHAERGLELINDTQGGRHVLRPMVVSALLLARTKLDEGDRGGLLAEMLDTCERKPRAPVTACLRTAEALLQRGDPARGLRVLDAGNVAPPEKADDLRARLTKALAGP